MKGPSLMVGELESGHFKIYVWGQHDDHVMDWRGCNYRRLTPPRTLVDQPRGGFVSIEDAYDRLAWIEEKPALVEDVKRWAKRAGSGTHLGDYGWPRMTDRPKGLHARELAATEELVRRLIVEAGPDLPRDAYVDFACDRLRDEYGRSLWKAERRIVHRVAADLGGGE